MKKLILIAIFIFTPLFTYGQCAGDAVCVPQAVVDRATAAATELLAAREVIAAFAKERTATEQERASAARLIDRLNGVIAVQDRLNLEYNAVINLYKEVVEMQSALIEKLTKRLDAPKSAWAKFVSALKTVATLLAGVAIGRQVGL